MEVRQVAPRLAVFNHVVLLGDESCPPPSMQDLIDATQQDYGGAFVVGEDLMTFDVGHLQRDLTGKQSAQTLAKPGATPELRR